MLLPALGLHGDQWTRSFSLVFRYDCVFGLRGRSGGGHAVQRLEHEQGTHVSPKISGTDDFTRMLAPESHFYSPFSWAALALKVSEKLGVHVALSSDLKRGIR